MRWSLLFIAAFVTAAVIYALYPYVFPRQGTDVSASEADAGAEITARLNDGEQLCVASPVTNDTGTVRVFESEDAVEGCSRLAKSGQEERLLRYSSFDNCEWAES